MLAGPTKDLESAPEQPNQVRPLLEEHHDKIRTLLEKDQISNVLTVSKGLTGNCRQVPLTPFPSYSYRPGCPHLVAILASHRETAQHVLSINLELGVEITVQSTGDHHETNHAGKR
jgi:hypothetical protein